jgi:hypothetical protein
VDAESRLAGQVVGGVQAREEAVLLARGVAQPAEDVEDVLRVDDERRLVVLAGRAENRAREVRVELLRDQLETAL